MQALPYSHDTSQEIGMLCVRGDWACMHRDFAMLRHIALQLISWLPDEIHDYLRELAIVCRGDVERAAPLWEQVKLHIAQLEDAWRPSDA
jgi:hypothetical protein